MPEETKGTDPVSPESASPAGAPAAPGEGAGSGAAKASAETSPTSAAPAVPPPSAPSAKAETPAAAKPAATREARCRSGCRQTCRSRCRQARAQAGRPKPEPWESELVTRLRSQYGSGIKEASTYLGQKYLVVDSSIVYEILLRMRDDELFDYCVDITAVHYPKREAAVRHRLHPVLVPRTTSACG